MNKPPHHVILLFLGISLALTGCNEEFTGDIFDPRLPEYSENGSDHAGAYVNNEPWRAFPRYSFKGSGDLPYFRFDSIADAYILDFPQGNMITPSGAHGEVMNLRFILSAQAFSSVIDGTVEYPLVIALSGEEARVELNRGMASRGSDSSETCLSDHGLIHIREVRTSTLEDRQRVLIAGTFGFDIEDTCGTYEVRSGRFDFIFRCPRGGCF